MVIIQTAANPALSNCFCRPEMGSNLISLHCAKSNYFTPASEQTWTQPRKLIPGSTISAGPDKLLGDRLHTITRYSQ
jgi:hypothetical protein